MRAWWLAVTVLACGGCDRVYGLSRDAGPDAELDAPPVDGPELDAPPPCALPVIDLPLLEDAQMNSGQPTQGHGTESLLNLGVGGVGEVILKFDATALPATGVHRFVLRIPAVTMAKECGSAGACGPCSALDRPGKLGVAFLRSDWAEATANYNLRSTGNPWQVSGAAGMLDRAPMPTIATYLGAGEAMVTFSADGLDAWLTEAPARLSVVVSPFQGIVEVLRQHEWNEACPPTPIVPTLVADLCP